MNVQEFKQHVNELYELRFRMPNNSFVPAHFHITEIADVSKTFIDCGGVLRTERTVLLQLWHANDVDHRLTPKKLQQIFEIGENKLNINEETTVQVEFQGNSIERYDVGFNGVEFQMIPTQTTCLASDACGIAPELLKQKLELSNISEASACCTPGGGCC
ncbi:MAG: hypothetical protein ACI8SE_001974 [Bacteroidia bacterium]|jgi:hypothetical protein